MSARTNASLVAAVVASGAVFAQTDSALGPKDPQRPLLEQIAALRTEGGPVAAGVIDPLQALALSYEERGDHALAIAALEEARHVTRVHEGLTTADEALLMRQQIRSVKALGDHQRVWDLEQDMITIARRHHDDVRMAPLFRELATDRTEALEDYLTGGFPPEIALGCYYSPGPRRYDDTRGAHRPLAGAGTGSCRSGQRSLVTRQFYNEILLYYADAIQVMVENGDYASQDLRDLEKQAFRFVQTSAPVLDEIVRYGFGLGHMFHRACRTGALDELLESDLLGSCLEPVIRAGEYAAPNVGGWASLVRLLAYEIRSDAPASARANAFADLADWHLLATPIQRRHFDDSSARWIGLYERAYRELEQDDAVRASIFSPQVPVMFGRNPFTSAATAESSRYVEASFNVTKYGRSEEVEIRETSEGATRAEVRDLIRWIEGSTFRPRFVDGEVADAAPVVVRYSLGP